MKNYVLTIQVHFVDPDDPEARREARAYLRELGMDPDTLGEPNKITFKEIYLNKPPRPVKL